MFQWGWKSIWRGFVYWQETKHWWVFTLQQAETEKSSRNVLQLSTEKPLGLPLQAQSINRTVTLDDELRPLALCLRSHEVKLLGRAEPAPFLFSPATETCWSTCGMELQFCGRGHFSESRWAAEFSNKEVAKMFKCYFRDIRGKMSIFLETFLNTV